MHESVANQRRYNNTRRSWIMTSKAGSDDLEGREYLDRDADNSQPSVATLGIATNLYQCGGLGDRDIELPGRAKRARGHMGDFPCLFEAGG